MHSDNLRVQISEVVFIAVHHYQTHSTDEGGDVITRGCLSRPLITQKVSELGLGPNEIKTSVLGCQTETGKI